jgi:hypothetical protein
MQLKKKVTKWIWRICGTSHLEKTQRLLTQEVEDVSHTQRELYFATRFHDSIIDSPWLKYKSFSLGGWAADYGLMYTLFRTMNTMKPKNILEFGLGQTSKMIHQYAKYFNTNAITCEHDEKWVDFFDNSKDGDYHVNVQLMNLQAIKYKEYDTTTYEDCSKIFFGKKFDLILVDGPLGSEHFSRSQIIDLAKDNLSQQFCIIIDDYGRCGEQETVEEVKNVLNKKNVPFCCRTYSAEKKHLLICSLDLKFLTTM